MPIYEYRCQACEEQFDKFIRSISQSSAEVACPACGSTEVQRLISAPAIHTGGAGDGGGEAASLTPDSPPVFGRKELQQAEEKKRQLRDQAQQEAKEAKKKR